jgi:hypothetical protein
MAGHTSAAMTDDWSDHLLDGEKAEAIQALDSKRFGKTSSRTVDSEAGASDRSRTYDKRFTKLDVPAHEAKRDA